jgi:hypothetical protein
VIRYKLGTQKWFNAELPNRHGVLKVMAEMPLTWPEASKDLTFNANEFARLCEAA